MTLRLYEILCITLAQNKKKPLRIYSTAYINTLQYIQDSHLLNCKEV